MIRRSTIAIALGLSIALSPVAHAQSSTDDAVPFNITAGVGTDITSLNFNWVASTPQEQFLQIVEAGQSFDDAKSLPAESSYMAVIPAGRHSHKVEVSGLKPDTEYLYRVGSDATGWAEAESITTGTTGEEWNFLVYGDPQIGSTDTELDSATWRQTVANSTAANPDAQFLLSVGDQIDWADKQEEYDGFFSPEQLDNFPLAVVNGNHDVIGASGAHSHHFNLPNSDAFGPLEPHNYWFKRSNALFVSLDTNFASNSQIQDQENFLRAIVDEHRDPEDWLIVTYHHSTYSQAYHQSDAVVRKYRQQMTPVLSELGVDVVFSGHDHIHTRSHLMDGNTPVDTETLGAPGDVLTPDYHEVLYYTANSASGSKFYEFAKVNGGLYTEYPEITSLTQSEAEGLTSPSTAFWVQDQTPDYTEVEVTSDSLVITTRNADDNSLVDQVTLDRTQASGPSKQYERPEPAQQSSEALSSGSSTDWLYIGMNKINNELNKLGLEGSSEVIDGLTGIGEN